jgi:uncharacterized membrane protein YqiK
MRGDARYEPVAASLPAVLPPITAEDALRYYRKLILHFGSKKYIPVGVLEARGGRRIWTWQSKARRCWIARKPTTGHHKGWGRLVHDASHEVFEKRHPGARAHDGGHATLEREMAELVMARGWLEPRPKPAKPTTDEKRALRLARTEAALARWEAKRKRAETAIKKLQARKRSIARALAPKL